MVPEPRVGLRALKGFGIDVTIDQGSEGFDHQHGFAGKVCKGLVY